MTNQYHNDDHPVSIYAIDNPVVVHTNARNSEVAARTA